MNVNCVLTYRFPEFEICTTLARKERRNMNLMSIGLNSTGSKGWILGTQEHDGLQVRSLGIRIRDENLFYLKEVLQFP